LTHAIAVTPSATTSSITDKSHTTQLHLLMTTLIDLTSVKSLSQSDWQWGKKAIHTGPEVQVGGRGH